MTRRSRMIWLALAGLFTLINGVGIGFAVAAGESQHAGVHIALTAVGGLVLWWLARDGRRTSPDSLANRHLDRLQLSVDAIAEEVQRVGAAQREVIRNVAEQSKAPAPPRDPE